MNHKHKHYEVQEQLQHNGRYNTQPTMHQSTQALQRGLKYTNTNKENNQNANNYYVGGKNEPTFSQFEGAKSMEFPHRLRTSINQQECGPFRKQKPKNTHEELKSSSEFFTFKQKMTTQPQQDHPIKRTQMTFGEAGCNGLLTSRDFLVNRSSKNETIEEIVSNAKRGLCKSFNQFNLGTGFCVNHPIKRAKYRLVAELSENQKEMFYCSKCAIQLLQQNFEIEEIKVEDQGQKNSIRLQQITRFELRLKSLEERARSEAEKNHIKEDVDLIEDEIACSTQRFDEMILVLQRMRNEWITSMSSLRLKLQTEEKVRKDDICDMLSNMRDIQQEINEYKNMKKFAVMKENQFQFIIGSLNNKINKFEENLQKAKTPSPCQKLSTQSLNENQIFEKLREELEEAKQMARERRQRQITFSRKTQPQHHNSEDDFVCDQLKRPFRVLFPSEELQANLNNENTIEKSKMLSSVRERATYDRYQ